jgi:hypothetical protein
MAGISHVFTISRVAESSARFLQEISIEMNPEDGRLTVLGPREEAITAFIRQLTDLAAVLTGC